MSYIIYQSDTGEILRTVSCPESMVSLQCKEGELWLPNEGWRDDTHYVRLGRVLAMPPRPAENHVFDYAIAAWVDPRTLEEARVQKRDAINLARAAEIDAPLQTPFGVFDSDPAARTSITDSVLLAQTLAAMGTPTVIEFTLYDNAVVSLDTQSMVTVGLLLGQKIQAAHAKSRTLKAQIDAATTLEGIAAISW